MTRKKKGKPIDHQQILEEVLLPTMYLYYGKIIPKGKRVDIEHFTRIFQLGAAASLLASAAIETQEGNSK